MIIILIGLVLCFLQITFVPQVAGPAIVIDLVAVFILTWSMIRGGNEALLLGFICGLILSPFSTLHFGFLPLFYTLIAFGSSLVTADHMQQLPWVRIAWAGVWCFVLELMLYLTYVFSGYPATIGGYGLHTALPRMLINTGAITIITPVCMLLRDTLSHQTVIGIKHHDST
ncbi:hypothetical protein AUK40_05895 [Candidatus Wirthbacteria bacterium CG2_30_54_11]|uniref:Rod shape-determining protein MreD n=1 Tax=Candidatus Wirthbacteria bacterium CG2_30_54_11 TaxID=1817892 RepID=A0A1J5IR06_9BACT|nr:MAG: hypothetical protein AUK40_05895 [Candidatus Wirthbacteria bacterium CG2_30_54_11]